MRSQKNGLGSLLCVCLMSGSLVGLNTAYVRADETKPTLKTQTASALDSDARLERKVSWNETDITLSSLLSSLSRKDLTLLAGPSCKEQKLQLRLKQRSLRALMQSLAELLPGEWRPIPDNKGYVLNLTDRAFHQKQDWLDLWRREQERVHKARHDALLQAMRNPPNISRPDSKQLDHSNEAGYAQAMTAFRFFQTLPAALQEQIAELQNKTSEYAGGFGHLDLMNEDLVRVSWQSLPQATRDWIRDKTNCPEAALLHDSSSALHALDQPGTQVVFLNTEYSVYAMLDAGGPGRTPIADVYTMEPEAQMMTADDDSLARLVKQVKERNHPVPETWKEMAARLQNRVWPNAKLATRPPREYYRRRADLINRLAALSDLEYVADYYSDAIWWPPMTPAEKAAPMQRPLREELDIVAAASHLSWKKRGDGLYLLRDNQWYHRDCLEVPNALVLKWLAPYLSKPEGSRSLAANVPQTEPQKLKAQLDWDSEVFTLLTPWQIGLGLQNLAVDIPVDSIRDDVPTSSLVPSLRKASSKSDFQTVVTCLPFSQAAQRVLYEINLLRFYIGLDETKRVALTEGNLALAALAPAQQANVLRLLPNAETMMASGHADALLLGVKPHRHGQGVMGDPGPQVDTRHVLALTASFAPPAPQP